MYIISIHIGDVHLNMVYLNARLQEKPFSIHPVKKKKKKRWPALKRSVSSRLRLRVHVKQNKALQHPSETAVDSTETETGLCTLFPSNAAE